MRFIELYGKRDIEFKTRYKSRTGLPPRYKVLDWKKEASMNKIAIKNGLIKNLILLSEKIDLDNPTVSKKLIECSRQVQNNKISLSALNLITQELMGDNKLITKEAQAFTDINLDFSGITSGLHDIRQNLNNIMQFINSKLAYLDKHPKTQKYADLLKNIWSQVNKLSELTNKQSSSIKESTKSIENAMSKDVVPKEVWFNDKKIKIQWEDDPTDEGYQRAVIYDSGKKYEVQEDNRGKRWLKEIPDLEVEEAPKPEAPKPEETSKPEAPKPSETSKTESPNSEAPLAPAEVAKSTSTTGAASEIIEEPQPKAQRQKFSIGDKAYAIKNKRMQYYLIESLPDNQGLVRARKFKGDNKTLVNGPDGLELINVNELTKVKGKTKEGQKNSFNLKKHFVLSKKTNSLYNIIYASSPNM
jgi:hypothetical protein